MDWQKASRCLGVLLLLTRQRFSWCRVVRNSVRFWDVDDLKALGAAVQGAIAEKEVTAKAEQ